MLQATAAVPRQSETFDLSSFRSSLQPRRAITCILITLAVICLCVIAIACIVVVREFAMSLMYRKSVCTLNNITYAEKDETCQYCSGYVDKSKEGKTEACVPIPFPCVQILVTFTDQTDKSVQKAMLYSDTNQASGTLRHCSYSINCLKTKEDNARAVEEYVVQIKSRRNTTFACYYDLETKDNVILQKLYSKSDVFHCLFWPSLVIVICAVIFLYMECHRQGMVICPRYTKSSAVENKPHKTNEHIG
jgi:hypothetical protein